MAGHPTADPLDEWTGYARGHLLEAALRLLGAQQADAGFPEDVDGVQNLISRVASGAPGEVMDFAVEAPGELPRYTGQHLVWVAPAGRGELRLRAEAGYLRAWAVTLHPDGHLGDIVMQDGFGVSEEELSEQARADREEVKRRQRREEIEEKEINRQIDAEQRRFRTEHLLDVRVAPAQDPAGLVVTWLALYDTGIILNYVLPRPADEEGDSDDADEALYEVAHPQIELSDSLGTVYEQVGVGTEDVTGPLLRASVEFTPAVPLEARNLAIRTDSGTVQVEVRSQ